MRRALGLTFAVLALTLSGCLVSEAPLISSNDAAYPLATEVRAERFKPDGSGWTHDENQRAYRSGASYILVSENGDEMEIMLKRIAEKTFIAQSKDDHGSYMYGLLVFDGNTIYEYTPDCSDFQEADLGRYGFVKKEGDDCTVTSAAGLASAYLAYLQSGAKPSGAYTLE
jgi:hypothetical protein